MSVQELNKKQNSTDVPAESPAPAPVVKTEPVDTLFSIEHQGMIASKYRAKYSEADQSAHKTQWPQFTGNHFMLYVLAETLSEARKAVFSRDKKIYLSRLIGMMDEYTPTVPGAVLTELQVACNRTTDLKLQSLYEQLSFEDNRIDLLKDFAKTLKQSAKTGRDTDKYRAVFYHAAGTLGVSGNTIW